MEEGEYQQQRTVECDHWWFQGMRDVYRSLLEEYVVPTRDATPFQILDTGCGTGGTSVWLSRYGRVVALDASTTALRYAALHRSLCRVQSPAERLPFRPSSFDLVTALGVIEHLLEDQAALIEMARVCRPGGWLLLLTSAYRFLWSHHDRANHHQRRYTAGELHRLVTATGWRSVRLSYVNTCLFPWIASVRLVQRATGIDRCLHQRDLTMPTAWINGTCRSLLATEAWWLRRWNLPFGVSLVCLAQRVSHG